jgi:plastocyanin
MGSGVVRGVVKFDGVPPKTTRGTTNDPCSGTEPPAQETVLVDAGGGLRNVLVSVGGAGRGDGSGWAPALLDQVECRYVPHVLGVQVGQKLRLRSSDARLHNVHYAPQANPSGNHAFTNAGDEREAVFTSPEVVRMKCDVHPWMTAYVGVFENPFFATTGEGGTFEIKGLPAGDYTLVAWHELYGRLEQPVKVADETKPAEATFTYKAPNP